MLSLYTYRLKIQALRINSICRRQQKKCVFFWSDVFAEEAIFYSDFGDEFFYKDDVQPAPVGNEAKSSEATAAAPDAGVMKAPAIKSIKFPSIDAVLLKPWCEISSRFFPLSPVFVKSRLLSLFR
jgi:hypothetical protein